MIPITLPLCIPNSETYRLRNVLNFSRPNGLQSKFNGNTHYQTMQILIYLLILLQKGFPLLWEKQINNIATSISTQPKENKSMLLTPLPFFKTEVRSNQTDDSGHISIILTDTAFQFFFITTYFANSSPRSKFKIDKRNSGVITHFFTIGF
jgi:hypothetical protein